MDFDPAGIRRGNLVSLLPDSDRSGRNRWADRRMDGTLHLFASRSELSGYLAFSREHALVGIAATIPRLLAGVECIHYADRLSTDPDWDDEILQRLEVSKQISRQNHYAVNSTTKVSKARSKATWLLFAASSISNSW